jgi:hypothetical protein
MRRRPLHPVPRPYLVVFASERSGEITAQHRLRYCMSALRRRTEPALRRGLIRQLVMAAAID